jgi:KDO2-lipid IV(A) lauroyltransferase
MKNWFRNFVFHPGQAIIAWVINSFFSLLPLDWASDLGGWIGKTIGPRLKVTENARRELAVVFPLLDSTGIEKIVRGMWDNLGRTIGEHPHLAKFNPYLENSRVEVIGVEILDQARDDNKPGIAFSGHLANWELVPLASTKRGLPLHLVYRRANNPFFDRLVQKSRINTGGHYFPKGPDGAKDILRALKKGQHLAMLVDQKMNDGIEVPFMGRNAMTAPALAQLALRFNCPVVPVQVERLRGANFRVTIHPPLIHPNSRDRQADILDLMTNVNNYLDNWIRQHPEQWLWIHNRWPNKN